MLVHIFKNQKGQHAFTDDATGSKLPQALGPWAFVKSIDMNRGEQPRAGVNTDDCLDDIDNKGYHLSNAKVVVN